MEKHISERFSGFLSLIIGHSPDLLRVIHERPTEIGVIHWTGFPITEGSDKNRTENAGINAKIWFFKIFSVPGS